MFHFGAQSKTKSLLSLTSVGWAIIISSSYVSSLLWQLQNIKSKNYISEPKIKVPLRPEKSIQQGLDQTLTYK